MRLRLVPAAALVAALGWAAASPGLPAPAPAPAPAPTPVPAGEFEVRLADDSVVKVTLAEPALVIATKYGKLNVPATDVRKIDLGFRYPEGVEAKIDRAITELGSPSFETREAAEKALVGFEHLSAPAVRRATHSADPEVSRRAAAILKKLEETLPAEKLERRDQDVVETAEFTARGRIEGSELKVKNRYFGESSLKLADVRGLRAAGGSAAKDVTVDGAYARANNPDWLTTTIDVAAGQSLEITATGAVDLRPTLVGGRYASNPNGLANLAGMAAALAGMPAGPGAPAVAAPAGGIPGQLIGRVGPNGTPFVIGSAFKGKAPAAGKLHLKIGSSPYPNDPSGSYKVKVAVGGP